MSNKTLNTLLAGAVAVTALAGVATSANAMKEGQEKCYGVVKTGMNGCASADKSHGCAGMAKEDASGVEWVSLPTGTCDKLAGGSTTPVNGVDESSDHDDETHMEKAPKDEKSEH